MYREKSDGKVIFPNELLDSKGLMGVITNPKEHLIGFAAMSDYTTKQENPYSITIYLLGWNHGLESYQVLQ